MVLKTMSKINNGGLAFPSYKAVKSAHEDGIHSCYHEEYHEGMTLRDYFAGQALTAMGNTILLVKGDGNGYGGVVWARDPDVLAKRAYELADAWIAVREVEK